MNRIINDPDHVVEDAIEGYLSAYPDYYKPTDNPRTLIYPALPLKDKVGIITGGGSGHEPAFLGYVGKNMLDAVAIGEIFSSPTAGAFLEAMKQADSGAGVACLYGNYAGDNMNVKMAMKKAAALGITVKTVVANDDVASAPASETDKRRGVAGEIFMWKVAGAAAALHYSLDEVIRVAQKAIDNCRSIGVGLTACTIPAAGKANFHIEDGQMELGIGHHGEPGVAVMPLQSASDMADTMLERILQESLFAKSADVAVLVSGLGATPMMELHIYYGQISRQLASNGFSVHRCYVGNYFTSLEMMGITLSVMKLDDELKKLLDMAVNTPALVQVDKS